MVNTASRRISPGRDLLAVAGSRFAATSSWAVCVPVSATNPGPLVCVHRASTDSPGPCGGRTALRIAAIAYDCRKWVGPDRFSRRRRGEVDGRRLTSRACIDRRTLQGLTASGPSAPAIIDDHATDPRHDGLKGLHLVRVQSAVSCAESKGAGSCLPSSSFVRADRKAAARVVRARHTSLRFPHTRNSARRSAFTVSWSIQR